MLPFALEQVDVSTLESLLTNEVSESKTIEYKRTLPGRGQSDTVPFLATVSSFANTSGGDLLLGVEADDGVPVALPGMEIDSLDREKLRLQDMMRNGLEPRLPSEVDIQPVQVKPGKYVLLLRVPRSWVAPHRVRQNNKFYARTSAGKYPLDVGEIRTAFTMSETVVIGSGIFGSIELPGFGVARRRSPWILEVA